MKIVISQPMKGKTEEQLRNERQQLVNELTTKGHEVIDTIFPDFKKEGNVPLKYLAKALEAIADSDAVYFMPGWKETRGCKIEHTVCVEYGIKILDYNSNH